MERPFPAYVGTEPYVFVSYSHKDSEAVFAELLWLKGRGFNVWYDEGIEAGTEWRDELARAVEEASVLLYFVTPQSAASQHCRKEVNFAVNRNIPTVAVHLQRTELPRGLDLTLSDRQALLKFDLSPQEYHQKLQASLAATAIVPRAPSSASLPKTPDAVSIAVLPFVNMSDDPDYFADGLSEELLNLLARIKTLKVAGRTSSFAFKGKREDLRDIGAKLNVKTVLEGSVRRAGERIRITAQLINVEDGFHIWSDTYNRELTDVFAIQDEIAGAIAAELKVQLGVESVGGHRPTQSMEAYSLYLEASALCQGDEPARATAFEKLELALGYDDRFAEAHQLIAEMYFDRPTLGLPNKARFRLCARHSRAAMALKPGSARISAFADIVEMIRMTPQQPWDCDRYMRALERAYTQDPANSQMRSWASWQQIRAGYFRSALDFADQVIARDPLFGGAQGARFEALLGLNCVEEACSSLGAYLALSGQHFLLDSVQLWRAMLATDREQLRSAVRNFLVAKKVDVPDTERFVDQLFNPETRMAALDSDLFAAHFEQGRAMPARARWLFFFEDERFWDAVAEVDEGLQLNFLMSAKSRWFLNHENTRGMMERSGLPDYWRKHGRPDFCDGDLDCWICQLDYSAAS